MLRDLLSNRLFLGSFLVVFVLFLVGLHFWSQQVHRELRESEEETRRLIRQFEEEQAATVPHAEQTEAADEEQEGFTFNPDTMEDISTTPLENVGGTSTAEPEIPLETEVETGVSAEIPDASGTGADNAVLEETIQFINVQFAKAIDLLYESAEIKRRSRYRPRSDGSGKWTHIYSSEDRARLQEIKYEEYELLSSINEEVPGSIKLRLRQHPTGWVGCDKFFSEPEVYEQALGRVPEEYYQYESELFSRLEPAGGRR